MDPLNEATLNLMPEDIAAQVRQITGTVDNASVFYNVDLAEAIILVGGWGGCVVSVIALPSGVSVTSTQAVDLHFTTGFEA